MNVVAEVLKILITIISIIIATGSLIYARKQRNVVKEEISKKRYLESAQSNLNEAIQFLRAIDLPDIHNLNHETGGDEFYDAFTIANDILRASFELGTKKIGLEISYELKIYESPLSAHRENDEKTGISTIQNFVGFEPTWLIKLYDTSIFGIHGCVEIKNFKRWISNDVTFNIIHWALKSLKEARDKLLSYEEVYENLSPDSVKKLNQLFRETIETVFETIRNPKRIQLDLNEFSNSEEIIRYLFKEVMNYPIIVEKLSRISELVDELLEIRKELFQKIM